MDRKKQYEINESRSFMVVKANELIQKSRFNLSLEEQKILLYLISKIKPEDTELLRYEFGLKDFCQVCGMDERSGGNYTHIKNTLKDLRDKSIWIKLGAKKEATLAWIDYVVIDEQNGFVQIKINELMKPYLLQLKEKFTQYELVYTLVMKSRYSIRLYELLKSYEYQQGNTFAVEDLKSRLSAEHYRRYQDFSRNVLDIALREINDFTDLTVTHEIIKEGRKYAKIKFLVEQKKEMSERMDTWFHLQRQLG
jgi:plasmid replication initiation protein